MASVNESPNTTVSGYRISPQQRLVWKSTQVCDEAGNAYVHATFQGTLDADRLKSAVSQVIQQHEILRTNFRRPSGMQVPFQVISEVGEPEWLVLGSEAANPTSRNSVIAEQMGQSFALDAGAVVRCLLIANADKSHDFVVGLPTLCADARSPRLLLAEIVQAYLGHAGTEPFQYADFAEWQYEIAEESTEPAKRGRAFWNQQLNVDLPTVRLPFERSGECSGKLDSLDVDLSTINMGELESVAATQEASLEQLFLTCWATLLWRMSGQEDFVTHITSKTRNSEDLVNAVGLYDRALPIACRFHGDTAFEDVLWQVARAERDAVQWQDYLAWDEATKPRIEFEFTEDTSWELGAELQIAAIRHYHATANVKLRLAIVQREDQVQAVLEFDPALYDVEEIARLAEHYKTLLESVARNGSTTLGRLELLSDAQRQRLMVALNDTKTSYPDGCIHHLFEQQVDRTPHAVALVYEDQQYTYAELNETANRLAHLLLNLEHRSAGERRIGLCVDRSAEMIIGLLGILKSGAAYVPVAPDLPKRRLEATFSESSVDTIVTVTSNRAGLPALVNQICLDDASRLATQSSVNPNVVGSADDAVYVIFTSGSTGAPKGVVVTHRSLVNYTNFICRRLGLDDSPDRYSFGTVSTVTADLGNTTIFSALASGGSLHVLSLEVATDGQKFFDYVSRHPIDVLKIVPSHFRALLAAQPKGNDIVPRRCLVLGGEALSRDLVDVIAEASPACEVINHYGPTETTIGCLTSTARSGRTTHCQQGIHTVPIGRPIANTEVYVFDENLALVPIGVPGELYVGGVGVSQGYLAQPELTAERFLSNPFSDDQSARLYRTGDRVRYLPDGQIEFLGRTDHQVKIRGFRIELGEIESVLCQHAAVREAVVLARDDEGDHKRLVAYIVPEAGANGSDTELTKFLEESLPSYMLPSAFVTLDFLPLTSNGKIDRKSLPAPEQNRRSQFVAPGTDAERTLAKIWESVLGMKAIGVNDNFFTDLGGDSILSIQIIARANAAGLRLVPKQVFECQTIAELAAVAGTEELHDAEQGVVTGEVPLTPIQHWFFAQDFAEPHHWNQSLFLKLAENVDTARLPSIVHKLVEHHDAFRMRFRKEPDGWKQAITATGARDYFTLVDLSGVAVAGRKKAMESVATHAQASLSLTNGPVVRWLQFDLGKDEPARLLIVCHHLVMDGVSWRLVLEDLQVGFASPGGEISLPSKTTSYKAWSDQLSEYAQSEGVVAQRSYWSRVVPSDIRAVPTDFASEEIGPSSSVTRALDDVATRSLLEEMPEKFHTQINDVLLTALVLGFSRWNGTRSLLVDLEGHGREEIPKTALWRTVGWFTTHYPVLLDLAKSIELGDSLKAIKEHLRSIPANGIGYGLLKYLNKDIEACAAIRSQPEPQVSFNYLGQLDHVLPASSPFSPAAESAGPQQSLRNRRTHQLSFVSSVKGGQLQLTCLFSPRQYRQDTVETLTSGIIEQIRALIDHCTNTNASAFTPSDFNLANLDEDDLSQVSDLLGDLDD